jgi:hypothetical protein
MNLLKFNNVDGQKSDFSGKIASTKEVGLLLEGNKSIAAVEL